MTVELPPIAAVQLRISIGPQIELGVAHLGKIHRRCSSQWKGVGQRFGP